ncbi:MAG: gamma-glutamyltransferase [Alphaproteobacteria bacterium]|nr:gamma-glutamyltransferase [Alphaproteobacteria bacterium]
MIDFVAGRPATRSSRGMVTSPHALASQAGAELLREGGSAVDAALAASAALSVLYPHMTGVGGDAFWLIYDAKARAVRYIDGGGRATSRGTLDAFARRGLDEVPYRGPLPGTLTVPGAVASWTMAHATYGRLPLGRCLASAIGYARSGFPVTERLVCWRDLARDELAKSPEATAIFLKDGASLTNPDLARTLEAIAADGWYGFYDGDVARELLRYSDAHDGFFTRDDLVGQSARWGEPIKGTYRDVTIYETPAPTQGFAVLEMLNLLEPLELHRKPLHDADSVHFMVQAKQLAYHDRDRFLADPRFADVPMARLVSKAYANERRALMDPARAVPWDRIPSYGSLTGDTVYIAAVDRDGNAASLIHSLYGSFGAAVVAGRTGVVLQNRAAYFSLDPKSPNRVEPGKTPLHTLIASLAFRDDKLWAVVGCMGADGQPQIHLQVYRALIDHGLDIQQALDMPRFLSGRFGLLEPRDTLHIEARFPKETIAELARRGHLLDRWGDWHEFAGHAHGITVDPATGTLVGGADPRSDGAAVGL